MKTRIMKAMLLVLISMVGISVQAYDFEDGGLYYNILSSNTVELTFKQGAAYQGNIVIPSKVKKGTQEYTVIAIGAKAFCRISSVNSDGTANDYGSNSYVQSVTIPNTVVSIGDHAFYGCNGLASVTFSSSLKSIGEYAFQFCTALPSLTIPNSVTTIGEYAFHFCTGLTSVDISTSLTALENGVFDSCSGLVSLVIPNSVTRIEDEVFFSCEGLVSLTIPNSVTSIGENVFAWCNNLNSVKVETGNAKYDSRNDCNAIIETASNTLIAGCKKTIIPSTVTSIGESAFSWCSGLSSITIPNSVSEIGEYAFYQCTDLKGITCFISHPFAISTNCWGDVDKSIPLHVPQGTKSLYQNTDGWKEFTNIIEIDSSDPSTPSTTTEQGPNYLQIWFKDGHTERHLLSLVKSISATKYDINGFLHSNYQMQQIVMEDTTYSYNISDIDNMSFRKVDKDELEKNVESVENNVTPIFEQCSTVEEMEARLDEIKNIKGVEEVWREGRNIVVQVRDWRKVYFYFPLIHKNVRKSFVPSLLKPRSIKHKKPLKKDGTPLSVVIAFQMTKDSRFDEEKNSLLELRDDLQAMGLDVHFIPDEEENEILDIDFYKKRMFDYDIVILDTHGSYSEGKHTFFTSEEVKGLSWYSLWQDLDAFDIDDIDIGNTGNRSYKIINEDLISKSKGKFQGSGPHIVFNGACESLSGDGELIREHKGESKPYTGSDAVAKIFFDKGADIYMGYNESTKNCGFAACDYFGLMLSGFSQEASFCNLWDGYKDENTEYKAALIDIINPNLDSEEIKRLFLFETNTKEKTEKELNDEYKQNKMITLNGDATLFSYGVSDYCDSPVKLGFELIYYDPIINTRRINAESYPLSYGDKVEFYANIDNLQPGRTYNYRAYTYDDIHYNYGNTYTFKIEEQQADEKQVMLTQNVGGTTYEIYKINTDKNDYHINPDGWKCYKSSLMLDMTKNGKTSTYTLDDNIYLDNSESHHGGQRPCLYLSCSSDQLFVFINSKDSRNNYTMDGYAYRSSLSNVSFTRETVFTGSNWGWSPYFTYSDGVLSVQHFSYKGYYAMTSYRNSDGTWTTKQGNYIKPDAFNEQSEQAGNVLIDDNPGLTLSQTQLSIVAGSSATVEITSGSGGYGVTNLNSSIARGTLQGTTVTIDGVAVGNDAKIVVTDMQTGRQIIITVTVTVSQTIHNGHEYVDLGLPSGTKWATCNVGASKPEEYGGYYAWGETEEKDVYNWKSYIGPRYSEIGGTQYDVAHVKWGGEWHMPTRDELHELFLNTTQEWTTLNGVNGFKFTGPNSNTLFIPAAGERSDSELISEGYGGNYWSSSLIKTGEVYHAYNTFSYDYRMHYGYHQYDNRYLGRPVRPVCK